LSFHEAIVAIVIVTSHKQLHTTRHKPAHKCALMLVPKSKGNDNLR